MCFLFNNVNFLFLLLFIINVKSDDDGVLRDQTISNLNASDGLNNPHIDSLYWRRNTSRENSAPGVQYNQTQDIKNQIIAISDIGKLSNDSINKINSREINSQSKQSNDLYYEILQTKPNSTVWSKFQFLIKPFVDKASVEESNGIIFSKRKNLTLPSNSSTHVEDKSKDAVINKLKTTNSSSDNDVPVEHKIGVRNTSNYVNITDRHFNSQISQDNSWTQVSTLQSNKDQIDRFKYPSFQDKNSNNNKYHSTKPTETVSTVTSVSFDDSDFNSLKRHTLATLYNKHGSSSGHTPNFYTNTKLSPTTPGLSSNIHPTVSSSSVTTVSNLQKPFGTTVTLPGQYGSNYQTSTKSPNESKKQISGTQGQVVSTTHKSWIHNQNKHDVKTSNDYYSAIITAADAIKKKHKPVGSTETVLFPYYDDELVTPVLLSSTKKPMQLISTTSKPLFSSSTKKPFNHMITLTKKPDFEYQTDTDTEPEEQDEDQNDEEEEEEEPAEYEETTTQQVTTKKPYKPLFVSSTAKPVLSKRPYIIRPVINVISQPLTTTKKPAPLTYKTTTTSTTTTPATTVTTALAPSLEAEDSEDEDDDSDDSDASEERKRRRKRPHPYQTYPLLSSPAPYLVYQQPIPQIQNNAVDKEESEEDDDEDDELFVNPLEDSDEDEDDEILEETVEVHKSPHGHGGGHIYDGER